MGQACSLCGVAAVPLATSNNMLFAEGIGKFIIDSDDGLIIIPCHTERCKPHISPKSVLCIYFAANCDAICRMHITELSTLSIEQLVPNSVFCMGLSNKAWLPERLNKQNISQRQYR